MPISVLDQAVVSLNDQNSVPITVGANRQAGDLRIVRVQTSSGRTFGAAPAGWTKLYDNTSGPVSRRVCVLYRVITGSEANATLTLSDAPGPYATQSITVRGWTGDPADIVHTITGSSSSTTSGSSPSITRPSAGLVILFYDTTVTNGNAGSTTYSGPSGWTSQGSGRPSGSGVNGYVVQMVAGTYAAAGTTAAQSATTSNAGTKSASAMFIPEGNSTTLVDVSDIATVTDDAVVAATSAADDAAAVVDTVTLEARAAVAEQVTITEQLALSRAGQLTDTITVTEQVSVTAIDYRQSADTVAVTDSFAVLIPVLKDAPDQASVSDQAAIAADVGAADIVTVDDQVALARSSQLGDQVEIGDQFAVTRVTTVTDTVTIADPAPAVLALAELADTATVTETVQILRVTAVPDTVTVTEQTGIGPAIGDSFTVTETVQIVDIPYTAPVILRSGPVYDAVLVARIPQQSGPPTLLEVDPIEWSTLTLTDTVSRPQQLSLTCLGASLTEPVKQRLRSPARRATELWLYRNGKIVFAGPLRGLRTSKQTKTVTLEMRGLLDYLNAWTIMSDKRFDKADQFAMVAWMVDQWQALEYGHYGIDTSTVGTSGQVRDGTYLASELHNVGKRAVELGGRINGFDIEVDPATRKLQLWSPGKGVDRSTGEDAIVFDDRNITDGDVLISLSTDDVASEAIGTSGAAGSDKILYSVAQNPELRAVYGRSSVTQSWSDITEQSTLDAHVAGVLEPRSDALIVPGPNLRITPDADLPDYDEGDTVAYTPSDLLGLTGAWRIRSRKVTAGSGGSESASLEFV